MIIGTMFFGAVKKVEGQYIETKFIVIGIPIAPISSMLVLGSGVRSRQGYEIPLHSTSIIAGYTRIISAVACFTCLVVGWLVKENTALMWGLALLIPALYFNLVFGKATQEEIAERAKLGNAIGIYALPEWFEDKATVSRLMRNLAQEYSIQYNVEDWKQELDKPDLTNDQLKLLYALAAFNYQLTPTPQNDQLYARADELYVASGQIYY